MKAPFPYFGGKSIIASQVWEALGDPPNYVEPFFGSGAVLLSRPGWSPETNWLETANDASGFVSNFWRAVQADPESVAHYADWPVNENDLHARHAWLKPQAADLVARLEGDPDYYDAKIAGWWCWGMCCWIAGGWCGPYSNGPWTVETGEDGVKRLVNRPQSGGNKRQLVHPRNAGMGVNRNRVRLRHQGVGVNCGAVARPSGGDPGSGECGLYAWMEALAQRLRRVRICCGDWTRVLGPTPTIKQGLTGIFLDPPYSTDREAGIYEVDDFDVAHAVREWALTHGDDPLLRIILCGYRGEHDELEESGWRAIPWKTSGGYASLAHGESRGKENRYKEVLWLSPHCLRAGVPAQGVLFEA